MTTSTSRRCTLAIGALALTLAACASAPTPADYASESPKLDLRSYFNGPLTAHGLFTDRSGKVVRRFTVKMTGTWNGNQGTLDEDFTYSDGKKEKRVWRLTDLGNGRMGGEHLFHLGREHVEPGHDDEVFGAIDEVQVAVVVDLGAVAGEVPTVEAAPVGLPVALGVPPDPPQHRRPRTGQGQVATALGHGLAVLVDQFGADPR